MCSIVLASFHGEISNDNEKIIRKKTKQIWIKEEKMRINFSNVVLNHENWSRLIVNEISQQQRMEKIIVSWFRENEDEELNARQRWHFMYDKKGHMYWLFDFNLFISVPVKLPCPCTVFTNSVAKKNSRGLILSSTACGIVITSTC